jgi:hypothetical protein
MKHTNINKNGRETFYQAAPYISCFGMPFKTIVKADLKKLTEAELVKHFGKAVFITAFYKALTGSF